MTETTASFKTGHQCLAELPEPYRTQFYNNLVKFGKVKILDGPFSDLVSFIGGCFVWDGTPEKGDYWNELQKKAYRNELNVHYSIF